MSGPKRKRVAIAQRKRDHLALAASGNVDFRTRSTLLEDVQLIHQALPETSADDIDLTTTLCGHKLSAPIIVSGMTGGTKEAQTLNRDLARAAQELGLAFGLGSQRAMALHPELAPTFQVRKAAPDVFLLGNLGAVQAREMGQSAVRKLVEQVGADALCVHLNPAMELVQDGGDRDFRGLRDTIARLVQALDVPVIAKETGCGISPEVAKNLKAAGVHAVDVSGAGGTSWVGVETERAQTGSRQKALGRQLWDWGIPTAVSVVACAAESLEVIATGGLRTGHDVARAIALGARVGGFAAPVLRAHRCGGYQGALAYLQELCAALRAIAMLSGCKQVRDLAQMPRVVTGELRQWLADLGLSHMPPVYD